MDRSYVIDSLRFWETLPDERKQGDDATDLKAELRGAIGGMDNTVLTSYLEIVRRQFAEQAATRASVASRGSALLLFVGVVSTGATVVGASLATSAALVLGLVLLVGAFLLYACLAVAFLAVRAQEVATWEVPAVYPRHGSNSRALAVEEAAQLAFAYQQNKPGLRRLVAYLADAQRWARRAVVLVVMLALLSVIAAASRPPPIPTNPSSAAATSACR